MVHGLMRPDGDFLQTCSSACAFLQNVLEKHLTQESLLLFGKSCVHAIPVCSGSAESERFVTSQTVSDVEQVVVQVLTEVLFDLHGTWCFWKLVPCQLDLYWYGDCPSRYR